MALLDGLLTAGQWAQFEGAIRLVTDTFGQLPVTYQLADTEPDRWGEDQAAQGNDFVTHELVSLGEYGVTEGDKNQESVVGTIEKGGIALSFNLEYLREKGLLKEDSSAKFNSATDYFIVKGVRYKVDQVGYDGQLRDKYALVVVSGTVDKQ